MSESLNEVELLYWRIFRRSPSSGPECVCEAEIAKLAGARPVLSWRRRATSLVTFHGIPIRSTVIMTDAPFLSLPRARALALSRKRVPSASALLRMANPASLTGQSGVIFIEETPASMIFGLVFRPYVFSINPKKKKMAKRSLPISTTPKFSKNWFVLTLLAIRIIYLIIFGLPSSLYLPRRL